MRVQGIVVYVILIKKKKNHNLSEAIVVIYWQSDVYKSGYWKFAQNYYQALPDNGCHCQTLAHNYNLRRVL